MVDEPRSAGEKSRSLPLRAWALVGLTLIIAGGLAAYVKFGSGETAPIQPKEPPPDDSAYKVNGPAWFRDVTSASGLDFTYKNGEEADQFTILESLGGGVALIDYDGDGQLDIFVTGGGYFDGPEKKNIKGHPCKLYRNLGGWKFQDVTAQVGLDRGTWWYSQGVAVADYDRDGFPDLLVTGYGRMALFRNEPDGKKGRRFVDVTEKLGLRNDAWSTSAGWADLDGDGFPDLYVCHYLNWSFDNHPLCKGNIPGVKQDVCSPQYFKPLVHALFRNEQGKAFRNVSADHGFKAEGCGLGVLLADWNDDGRPDIYVANDTNSNFLYFNRGGGKLEESAVPAGAAMDETGHRNGSMGLDAADFDGSGRPSLWVTVFQYEQHALYKNLGRELFHHDSRAAGIASLSNQFVGFGTGFLDANNDGWEDIFIAHGHVFRFPAGISKSPKQRAVLLQNVAQNGRRRFHDASAQGGEFFQTPALGRGVAIGDLDNDGWPDLIVSHNNSPVTLLRNEAALGPAKSHRWLGVKLFGREGRDAVGSTVIVQGTTRKLTRFAKGGGSYLSANDPRLLFGLGDSEQVQSVTVKWSWGPTQTWDNLEPNHYWDLHEGQALPRRGAYPTP